MLQVYARISPEDSHSGDKSFDPFSNSSQKLRKGDGVFEGRLVDVLGCIEAVERDYHNRWPVSLSHGRWAFLSNKQESPGVSSELFAGAVDLGFLS